MTAITRPSGAPAHVAVLVLLVAVGAIGAATVGLTAGFADTDDARVVPVRLGGALITGFVAGLAGRGIRGWVAVSAGAAVAVLPFSLRLWPDPTVGVGFALSSCIVLAPGYLLGYGLAVIRRSSGGDALPGNVPRANWPSPIRIEQTAAPPATPEPLPTLPATLAERVGPAGWATLPNPTLQRLRPPKQRWLTGARFAALAVSVGGPTIDFFAFWGLAESGALSEDDQAATIAVAAMVGILVGSFVAAGLLFAVDGRGLRGAAEALVVAVPGAALLLMSSENMLQSVLYAGLIFIAVGLPVEAGYVVGRFVLRRREMRKRVAS